MGGNAAMSFDAYGRVEVTPRQLFESAIQDARRLIDHYLIRATPRAFPTYSDYCDFLYAVSERIAVHPSSLFLRGSCQIGFSISPRVEKVWMSMDEHSDLDLAIIDAAYYEKIDQEVIRWEERNRADRIKGPASERFESRQQDRFYNCCRVDDLPNHLCAHHSEAMINVAKMRHCGTARNLKAFVFRDWYSVRSRYLHDLKQLTVRVPRILPEPGDGPLPRVR
jgi:hypothetical protein